MSVPRTIDALGDPTPGAVLRLPDGRRLGYLAFGDPRGVPCLFFHGIPGSRRETSRLDAALARAGIRGVSIDRPGYGLSDRQPGRTFLDWPKTVAALTDALDIDRFMVVGISGGCAYAAACALEMPERLIAVTIVSGMGRLDDPEIVRAMPASRRLVLSAGQRLPVLLDLAAWRMAVAGRRRPERLVDGMRRTMAEPDRAILARSDVQAMFRANFAEAFRQGWRGVADDYRLYTRPWGFRPEDISVEVDLYHGEADRTVPVIFARRLAAEIPRCRATFYPGEGHLLAVDHLQELVERALRHAR